MSGDAQRLSSVPPDQAANVAAAPRPEAPKLAAPRYFEQLDPYLKSGALSRPVAVDWNGFKANAQKRGTDEQTISSMQKLYAACESLGAEIAWGRGIWIGSFNPKWPAVHRRAAPFSVS